MTLITLAEAMQDADFVLLNGIVFEAGYLRAPDEWTVADDVVMELRHGETELAFVRSHAAEDPTFDLPGRAIGDGDRLCHGRDADDGISPSRAAAPSRSRQPASRTQPRLLPGGRSHVRGHLPQCVRADRGPHR